MQIFNLITYILFSIMIMVAIHFFYNFLKDNLTTKKVRYLGQFQNEKYQELLNELKNKEINEEIKENKEENNDFISSIDKAEMQKSL